MIAAARSRALDWDYSALARHYEKRAPYSAPALAEAFERLELRPGMCAVDIGAGTGRLTKAFARAGLSVRAVEPNAAMRDVGLEQTRDLSVTWMEGVGEDTTLDAACADVVGFGSSFNVVDPQRALTEAWRVLRPNGGLLCTWNHRDLDDPLQQRVEETIRDHVRDYRLGTRRDDPGATISASKLFTAPDVFEHRFTHRVRVDDFIDGFRAHATLIRQCGDRLEHVLAAIADAIGSRADIDVPFFTRVWCSRRIDGNT